VILPCDDAFLRAAATQRPNYRPQEHLPMRAERALTNLLMREVKLQMKAENLKRCLEQSYDFSVQGAFKVIDDWNYKYIDENNLKRFLRNVGYLASKQELVAIIRRIDLDGDAKINLDEFNEGVRSQFSLTSPHTSKPTFSKQPSRSNLVSASKKSKSTTPMKPKLSKVKRRP
jgi:hypothetical protein